jgi:hypothetical protein
VTIGFQIGFRSIERAYRESRRAFENEIADWNARWAEYEADVRAGRIDKAEAEASGFDYGEYVGENILEAEQGLRLIREAFALVLYHFWEREACSLLNVKRYEQTAVFEAARSDPQFQLDELGLDRLRLIVNCIKHDNGFALHAQAAELFDPQYVPANRESSGWHTALTLRDTDLDTAFAAVKASGPRSGVRGERSNS